MCKLNKGRKTSAGFSSSVLLPVIAGLLHLNATFQCLITLISISDTAKLEQFRNANCRTEISIFIAYSFDLFCCYACSIVPFSRCRESREIAMHHLPVVLFIQPLILPVILQWKAYDPVIIELILNGNNNLAYLLTRASTIGYISSFNEAIMCFQRAELTFYGRKSMSEDSGQKCCEPRIFTSGGVQFLELCYKLMIFMILPLFSCKAMFQCDFIFYKAQMKTVTGLSSFFKEVVCPYFTSPTVLRTILYRFFMIMLYPSMGKKTYQKVRQHLKLSNASQKIS